MSRLDATRQRLLEESIQTGVSLAATAESGESSAPGTGTRLTPGGRYSGLMPSVASSPSSSPAPAACESPAITSAGHEVQPPQGEHGLVNTDGTTPPEASPPSAASPGMLCQALSPSTCCAPPLKLQLAKRES